MSDKPTATTRGEMRCIDDASNRGFTGLWIGGAQIGVIDWCDSERGDGRLLCDLWNLAQQLAGDDGDPQTTTGALMAFPDLLYAARLEQAWHDNDDWAVELFTKLWNETDRKTAKDYISFVEDHLDELRRAAIASATEG